MKGYISKLRNLFGAERNLPEGIGCATYQRLPMVRSRSGALRLRDGRWLDLDAPELIRVHDALDGKIDFEHLIDVERENYSILRGFFGEHHAH